MATSCTTGAQLINGQRAAITKTSTSKSSALASDSELPDGVQVHGATIRIDFRYRGVRCRETLKGLRVTKANIKFAEKKRAAILHEIGREIFDYSKHFPESPRCRVFGTNPDRDRTVDQALDLSLVIVI